MSRERQSKSGKRTIIDREKKIPVCWARVLHIVPPPLWTPPPSHRMRKNLRGQAQVAVGVGMLGSTCFSFPSFLLCTGHKRGERPNPGSEHGIESLPEREQTPTSYLVDCSGGFPVFSICKHVLWNERTSNSRSCITLPGPVWPVACVKACREATPPTTGLTRDSHIRKSKEQQTRDFSGARGTEGKRKQGTSS